MNSNQLNAINEGKTERKTHEFPYFSSMVKGKSRRSVGYPPFINSMLGAVKISVSGKRISGMSECGIKISDRFVAKSVGGKDNE